MTEDVNWEICGNLQAFEGKRRVEMVQSDEEHHAGKE